MRHKEEIRVSRVYNFSAGPAVLPEEVLQEAAAEMMDYKGSGMSVMEMSHRSKWFDDIIKDAEKDLRELMNIPDNYKVLFLQGGASQFFAEVPMNLMKNKKAGYIITGQWAKKAFAEAKIYGNAVELASSADETFSYIPDCSDLPITDDMDYVYICENNTIYGTKYKKLPNTKGKNLVADVSSCFLSEPVDVSKYAVIYGGVQKNVGPAGVVIAIIREDLITDDCLPGTPTMLKWKTQADNDSLYNTPPCYGIYICGKVFKWLKKMGGLSSVMGMMPGMGIGGGKMPDIDTDEAEKGMARTEAIIYSMTPEERRNPKLLNPSRKARIARGAGVDVSEVNRLVKQFEQTKKFMKQMPGMMGGKKGRRGGGGLGGLFKGLPF